MESSKNNHLLKSMYLERWQSKSHEELLEIKNKLQTKINTIQGSKSVVKSLSEVMELLDNLLEQQILAKK